MLLRLSAAPSAVFLACGLVSVVSVAGESVPDVPISVTAISMDELEEVQITGLLEETLPQSLSRYGSRVGVLGDAQLQQGGYKDVAQALQAQTPGMYIAPLSGAFDYVETSFHGARNSELVWLVDGIRINNRLYATTTPLDTIPAHLVERIEVLEGGQSLFYGTQAIAGVVNIVTRQFSDEPKGQIELGADTNSGKHLNGFYSTIIGDHRLVMFGSTDEAKGFKPFLDEDYDKFDPASTDRKRGYDVQNYGLKYAYDFGDNLRTSFGLQHTDAVLDFARPGFIAKATNDRNEDLLTAKIDYSPNENLDFYIKGYYHDWDTLYNEIDNDGSGGTEVISDNEFWGFEDHGANLLTRFAPGGSLEYFVGWDYQRYSGVDEVYNIAPRSETVHAPFVQLRTSPAFSDSLRLSLGARFNNPSHGESATVWTATGHWDISDGLFARTNFGTAFRLPSAYELFVDVDDPPFSEFGNPALKPERSTYLNLSIGGRSRMDDAGFSWELVGFFRNVKDLVGSVDLTSGDGTTFDNVPGTTKVRGGELILSGYLPSGLSANASFTVQSAKAEGATSQQAEIPKSMAKVAVNYEPAGGSLYAGMTASHTGKVYRSGINYGNYTIVDLNGGLRMGADDQHRIGVRLENALGEEYASRIRGSAPSDYRFRGTPRTLHATYAYRF